MTDWKNPTAQHQDSNVRRAFDSLTKFLHGVAPSGAVDHGTLTGLADDDHTQYQKESEKGAASGYASLGAGGYVPTAQLGSGAASSSTVLYGDNTWGAVAGGSASPDDANLVFGLEVYGS